MAILKRCSSCKSNFSLKKYARARKCPQCGAYFTNVYQIDIKHKGERINRVFTGTLEGARKYEAKIKEKLRLGEPIEENKAPTLQEYYEKTYFPHISAKLSSAKDENSTWRKHILPSIGEKPLNKITAKDIEDIIANMRQEGLRPRTQERVKQFIRKAINLAIKMDILPKNHFNPANLVEIPKYDNSRKRVLTKEEWEKIAEALRARNEEVYLAACIAYYTGFRRGEVARLRWEDIELGEEPHIRIPHQKDSSRSDLFPIASPLKKELEAFYAKKVKKKEDLGRRVVEVTPDTISHVFTEVVNRLGLNEGVTDDRNRVTFHTLRHTFVTLVGKAAKDLSLGMAASRHSSTEMFLRYSHSSFKELKEILDSLYQS